MTRVTKDQRAHRDREEKLEQQDYQENQGPVYQGPMVPMENLDSRARKVHSKLPTGWPLG